MDVKALPTFNCLDTDNISARWKRWHRAFELYVTGKGVTDADQKKALLLHTAGMETQDIYYTLQAVEGEIDVYEKAVKALTDYFTPKANVPYERHMFRSMAQTQTETVDQFVTRLKTKADNCDFEDKKEEQIRDQVIEKCVSHRLRRKLLEKGGALTLRQLTEIARINEDSKKQASSIEGLSTSVNSLTVSKKPHFPSKRQNNVKTVECFSCGRTGHMAKDLKCPAKDKKCRRCHVIGHFENKCKTKQSRVNRNRQNKHSAVRQLNETQPTGAACGGSDDEYTFSIGGSNDIGKTFVNVGGVNILMIIDSGATCNIVDRSTWEHLKHNKVTCKSSKATKQIYAYGSVKPLTVAGSFKANIQHGDNILNEVEFLVFEGKGQSLLGKETAVALHVLCLKPEAAVNTINTNKETYEQKFPKLFEGVGKYNNFQLHVPVNKEVTPVTQSLRRVPYHLRAKLDDKLNELEQADIIERWKGPSTWVSPLVCVPKSNSEEVRICVDMRRANEAVIRERHPIPTIEDIMQDLNKSSVFSKLDLRWGYHQIELDEESREITTFSTHRGLYCYKRLMFGISCAPEMYQKVIQQLFNGCEGVHNILDDIIVHGASVEEHNKRLNKVLYILNENGLTLNKGKCQFGVNKLVFMGHLLSDRGVGPAESKVTAVMNAREPKNASEVKSFLGLVTYSSRFIPDFSTVSAPLRELTKKNAPFEWGDKEKRSFERLKKLLSSAKVLGFYDIEAETQVIADASPVGLGAVLVQKQKGEFRVICYASKSLSDIERRYSQTEKEALGLVWACERFHVYLFGTKFELLTDHKPLEFIYSPRSKPSARIERWVLRLQPYDYKVRHIPGKKNIADVLSRLVSSQANECREQDVAEEYIRFVAKEATPVAMTTNEIELASDDDSEMNAIRVCLLNGSWHQLEFKEYLPVRNELSAIGKLVLRGTRIVVPNSLRKRVMLLAHEGHPGIVSMKRRLRVKVWWPGIDRQIEMFCKSCHGCQLVSQASKPEPMVRTDLPSGPWQDLAADILGPLPSGDSIFVVVDYYSRYFEIEIVKSTTTEKILFCLDKMFVTHGLPVTLRTDNGPQFVSKEFTDYLDENGISHRRTTPLWPQANGEVERQNRSIMKRVRIAQSQNIDWKADLKKYLIMYRSTPHSTTGVTPAEMLFNRPYRTKLPQLSDVHVDDLSIRDRDSELKEKGKMYADKRRGARESDIQAGDKVLVRQDKVNKFSTALGPSPLTVRQKHGNSVLVESDSGVQYRRNITSVKRFYQPQYSDQDVVCNPSNQSLSHEIDKGYEESTSGKEFNNDTVVEVAGDSCGPNVNPTISKKQEVTQEDQLVSRKSDRVRKMPAKYGDFVMK